MIPASCKRLIEVDFPIGVVSEHSAREKSIRHGHPSTLHLWWARRPLGACRSVLMGLLLPDPCDKDCPPDFKADAWRLLSEDMPIQSPLHPNLQSHAWNAMARGLSTDTRTDLRLRELLLNFIGDLADWDNSSNSTYLDIARGLVKAAHPEETPVVVDPFAGGGSIPLEALRLGCEAFASDLNPVACLILKTLLEDIPKYGNADFTLKDDKGNDLVVHGLANALRHVGAQVKKATEEELAEFYPSRRIFPDSLQNKPLLLIDARPGHFGCVTVTDAQDHLDKTGGDYTHYVPITARQVHEPTAMIAAWSGTRRTNDEKIEKLGARPITYTIEQSIAYLWARTVRCEAIGCGAEIPLVRSFWLSKKAGSKRALRYTVERGSEKPPHIVFDVFAPKSDKDVPSSTVRRADATCPCCDNVLPAERVRAQLAAQHGGADVQFDGKGRRIGGATLLAVVTLRDAVSGRNYRLALDRDYAAVHAAQQAVASLPIDRVPQEPLPMQGTLGFRIQLYGMLRWGDLFTSRQKLTLTATAEKIRSLTKGTAAEGAAIELAALALSRFTDISNALCRWESTKTQVRNLFTRQAIPMLWDFAEADVFGDNAGNYMVTLETMARVVDRLQAIRNAGQVRQADARHSPLPDGGVAIWFTDPPYYDAVPYADLSDFFFVWLKRVLPGHPLLRDPSDPANPLTPKTTELVQDKTKTFEGRPKDQEFFETGAGHVFCEGRRVLAVGGVGCVVFAHKTTEGWEALLSGMTSGGWTITASWPITTELGNRLRARDSAALAGSVHLVCRPRPPDAGAGDWSHVKAAMEKRIREWLPTLAKHGVRGADAVFSCLGPALESYSRYDKVLTAADHEVPLGGDPEATEPHKRGFLAYVFEAVSKEALRQVLGDADTEGFEEDSRMTALFLWTLQTSKQKGKTASDDGDASDEADSSDADEDEEKAKAGFSLPFDTFIRITRPMGIHYPSLEGRVIEIEKGIVRLLPVRERSEQLLGEAATRPDIEISIKDIRQMEFGLGVERQKTAAPLPTGRKKGGKKAATIDGTEIPFTTLDRIHRAMLLFTLGRSTLLRQVLEQDMRQGKQFERLALALNALYPDGCDERRMLEGVQAAMRGFRA